MRDLTNRAIDTASQLGAGYADIRVIRRLDESIAIRSGRVEGVASGETEGFGVRALVDGAWGFASSHRLTTGEADRVAGEAVRIARASATALRQAVRLDDRPPVHGSYETPVEIDPFSIALETKVGDLLAADRAAGQVKGISFTESMYSAQREWKTFAATDGSYTEQVLTHVGSGFEANAVDGDEHQRRSYPDATGGWQSAGYEFVRGLDLAGHAEPYAEEAVALLTAPQCPPGQRTIVLDPTQLYMQIHESCGHPAELDRTFGTEASYAGTSFLTTDKLDAGFRYGSDLVTIVADAGAPGGLGTFGWDDEGVEAQTVPIVRDGVLAGFLSSRESAAAVGLERSGGCCRAEGFARQPIVRMTNVNLEPGDAGTLADLIADTDDGIYMETNRSWSIDNRRLHFQFATEAAWEIRGGERGRLLRNPSYAGVTPEFWSRLDAVCSREDWRLWSVLQCGKGEPGQAIHASHGTAPVRVRDVEVGTA
jgi:TldD protein